nr:TRIO and F-actin-binding protein-like isoform X1 [Ipomoea batatas]GMD88076.1 TRIO and F-actin-binding protein-like isoform X1 [Ipomoea batatas]
MVWQNGLVVRASALDRLVVRASAPDRLVVRASAPDRLVVRASAPERSVVRASAHMLSLFLLLVLRCDLVFRMDWCSVGLELEEPQQQTPLASIGGEKEASTSLGSRNSFCTEPMVVANCPQPRRQLKLEEQRQPIPGKTKQSRENKAVRYPPLLCC